MKKEMMLYQFKISDYLGILVYPWQQLFTNMSFWTFWQLIKIVMNALFKLKNPTAAFFSGFETSH